MKKFKKAFTLIELLIVISIIAILATLILVNVSSARKKARDAKRKADLKSLQTAVEMYNDATGSYPQTSPTTPPAIWGIKDCGYGTHTTTGANGYIPNLAPTYVANLPLDPTAVRLNHCYLYMSNGTDYKIMALGTPETGFLDTDAFYDPNRPSSAWQVSSSGGRNW